MSVNAGFGPRESDVLHVLEQAAHLPPERLPELIAIATSEEPGEAATGRGQITRLRREPEYGPQLARVEQATRQWASELRFDHLLQMGGYEMGSGVDPRTRSIAARVLYDAVAALIVRDRLSADEFEALFGPWDALANGVPDLREHPDR